MAVAREQYAAENHVVPPAIRGFLDSLTFGRFGLRMGRKLVRFTQKLRDPIQRKLWIRQVGLPFRNAILLNRPLTLSFDGIPVRLAPRGATAGDFWAGLRCETHEVTFILNALKPGMLFFDVGANAGLFAISAAKKLGGKQVFAFEPCSSTYNLLKQNLRLNHLAEVNIVRTALSDSVGTGVMQINAQGNDGLNTLGKATHPYSKVIGHEEVPITTLDLFVKENKIPQIDVMKVDIEGAELNLFRGAKTLLERADAPLILYEGFGLLSRGFGYHPVEILWFLESCGYTLLLLNSETGKISRLTPDYQYDSMVIAVKPGHASYQRLCESIQ